MKCFIKTICAVLACAMIFACITGCTASPAQPGIPTEAPATDEPVQHGPSVIRPAVGNGSKITGAIEREYSNALAVFSAKLVESLGENWTGVVSPLSFSLMLELLSNGADETEQQEIAKALALSIGIEPTNENSAKLISALTEDISSAVRSDEVKGAIVRFATAILVQYGDRFAESFEQSAADYYKASVGNIDFSDTEEALRVINGWVEENTNGLIPKLFDQIYPNTDMALVNALYFKAAWQTPFMEFGADSGLSDENRTFHGVNGDTVATMLIGNACHFKYAVIDGTRVALIPYAGGEYYMAVVLPEEGASPASVLGSVLPELGKVAETDASVLNFTMPKVSLSSHVDAMKILDKLGLGGIADGSVVFPGIVDEAGIIVTQFVHAAVMNVDANGTEAAAATGVTGTKNAAPGGDSIDFTCNRPYAMAIVHAETMAVLFTAVVNDVPAN